MSLSKILLIAALVLNGCGGGDNNEDPDNSSNTANNESNTSNNDSNGFGPPPDRPALVEPEGCYADPARPLLEGSEITYSQDTEAVLGEHRQSYLTTCSVGAEIDWISVFSSVGFDDDEYENAGAVTNAVIPFLTAAEAFCYPSEAGNAYRAAVELLIFMPTDTDDRIGLCLDEEASALVYRFKLVEGDTTAEAMTEQEVTDWLTENIQ